MTHQHTEAKTHFP